jgi:hypothetical protein
VKVYDVRWTDAKWWQKLTWPLARWAKIQNVCKNNHLITKLNGVWMGCKNNSISCNWVIFCHNKWIEINCCFIMTVAQQHFSWYSWNISESGIKHQKEINHISIIKLLSHTPVIITLFTLA